MAKESSKEFSVFVLWEKESFSSRHSPSRNSSSCFVVASAGL